MTLRDPKSLPLVALGTSLVLAPLAYLVSTLVAPPLESDDRVQLAQMAGHPDRTYLFALFTVIGSILLLPAVLGIVRLLADRAGWLGYLGAGLTGLGVLVAIGDSFGLFWDWQMAEGGNRAQMASLLHRFDAAAGVSILFTIGGFGIMLGCVLLGAALWRADAVPRLAAAALPVGAIANIVGFASNSRVVLDVSATILLVAFLPVARRLVGRAEATRAVARRPLPGTP